MGRLGKGIFNVRGYILAEMLGSGKDNLAVLDKFKLVSLRVGCVSGRVLQADDRHTWRLARKPKVAVRCIGIGVVHPCFGGIIGSLAVGRAGCLRLAYPSDESQDDRNEPCA